MQFQRLLWTALLLFSPSAAVQQPNDRDALASQPCKADCTSGDVCAVPEIPACITGEERVSLEQTRRALIQRAAGLQARSEQSKANCSKVEVGSPQEAQCQQLRDALIADICRYSGAIDVFSESVALAARCQEQRGVSPAEFKDDTELLSPESGQAIHNSGILPEDANAFCAYVRNHGGQIIMQNVSFGDAAHALIKKHEAVPKPISVPYKSSDLPLIRGLVPIDQANNPKVKLTDKEVATKAIQQCLSEHRCRKRSVNGVEVLADSQGNVYVSDYDPLAFSYSRPGETVTNGPFGTGTDSARQAIFELNRSLILPIVNLDAAHNPECQPPDPLHGSTAFERDSTGGCTVKTLFGRTALDDYLRQNNIPACWQN